MSELDPNATTGGDYVQFPDDSTYTGKKILYAKETIDDVVVYLPTTIMVDADGNVIDLAAVIKDQNQLIIRYLHAMVVRLDILNGLVKGDYDPPDNIINEGEMT